MNHQYKKIAEVASLAGRILLESNAESYRIEDTVNRILDTTGLEVTEAIANSTGLYITLDGPDVEGITRIHRIEKRGNHMRKIYRVNDISRKFTTGEITVDQAYEALKQVDVSEYTIFHTDAAVLVLILSFVVLLGGKFPELFIGIIASGIIIFSNIAKSYLGMNDFIHGLFATILLGTIVPIAINWSIPTTSTDIVIVSALMPLFPGVAFTNGIRDFLKGDYNAGLAKVAEAMIIAVSLALGIAFGLFISKGAI